MKLNDALQPTAAARHPLMGVRVERWQSPGQQPKYTVRDLSQRDRRFEVHDLPDDGWECAQACEHGNLDWFEREGNVIHTSRGDRVFENGQQAIIEAWRLQASGYCDCKWNYWDRYSTEGVKR